MRDAILRSRTREWSMPRDGGDLAPRHRGDFLAPLAGQDQHAHDGVEGAGPSVAFQMAADFVVGQHAVAPERWGNGMRSKGLTVNDPRLTAQPNTRGHTEPSARHRGLASLASPSRTRTTAARSRSAAGTSRYLGERPAQRARGRDRIVRGACPQDEASPIGRSWWRASEPRAWHSKPRPCVRRRGSGRELRHP